MNDHTITIGEREGWGESRRFGISAKDQRQHLYIIGKTGVGKSTLIETLARQDLEAGRGFALIDPHGDLVERVAYDAVAGGQGRVAYLNAPDGDQPFGYNPLRKVRDDKIPLAASGLIETLRKLWPDAWGVRMEHVLRNSLYALLEQEDARLPDILRLYADEKYRKSITRSISNGDRKDRVKYDKLSSVLVSLVVEFTWYDMASPFQRATGVPSN